MLFWVKVFVAVGILYLLPGVLRVLFASRRPPGLFWKEGPTGKVLAFFPDGKPSPFVSVLRIGALLTVVFYGITLAILVVSIYNTLHGLLLRG